VHVHIHVRFLMNGDEVVKEHTLYLLFQLHSRSWDVWTKLYQFDIVTVWMSGLHCLP
jgi:hypothetical protein